MTKTDFCEPSVCPQVNALSEAHCQQSALANPQWQRVATGRAAAEMSELLQEAQGAVALYDFSAAIFLTAIEVPGTNYVVELASRLGSIADPLAASGIPGASDLVTWSQAVLADEAAADKTALAEKQRRLAADRTFLFRAPVSTAPLPPYESYHREGATPEAAPSPALGRTYAAAEVHVAESYGERDDYLGCELAFAGHLASEECLAIEQGDTEKALRLNGLRTSFESEHLAAWASGWCAENASKASTEFFRGFLTLLGALLAESIEN